MIIRNGNLRAALLGSAGSAALASLIASGAHAAETRITPETSIVIGSTEGHAVVNVAPLNTGTVEASITASTTTSSATGTASAVSATVDSNAMRASATGNDFANAIDLSVIPADDVIGTGDGAASLAVSINLGTVSSVAESNAIGAQHADFALGTLGVADNSISATSTGNRGSTLLQGAVVPAYASDTAGSSTLFVNGPADTDWFVGTGSLVASTLQMQAGAISNTASASNNDIYLTILNAEDDASVIASPALEDNSIAASVVGNSANSTIDVLAGGAATLTGTAVITNGQVNGQFDLPSDMDANISATNSDSTIIATIAADGANTSNDAELQGSLSVTGNAITASASGNRSLGDIPGQAGNRILLADGASFEGSEYTADHGTEIAYTSGALLTTVNADLAINNSQANLSAGNANRLSVVGSADEGEIAAVVDDISGGAVAVSDNEISGTATGNTASSALSGGDNMASFTGSAALANQQVNFFTNVFAEGTGRISARVSDDPDSVTESTVSVDLNKVVATAYGNSASQSLSLDAVEQSLPRAGVVLTGGTGGSYNDGNVSGDGSLTVTNIQANYGSDVDASQRHEIGTFTSGHGVTESTVSVTRNRAEAVALGASAGNSLALSGTTVGGGAGIVSVQINDDADGNDADATDVSASSNGSTYHSTVANVEASALEVSGNLQRAIAYGGSAGNTLSVTAETITVDGNVDGIASSVAYDQSGNDGMVLTFVDQPEVDAAYGALNVQSLNGDIAATALSGTAWMMDASFAVVVDGSVDGSTVINGGQIVDGAVVGGNALVAAAYGAEANNAASLDVGTLDTSSEEFASVLNLTNVQEVTASSTVTAQAAGEAVINTIIVSDLTGSTVATSFNTVQALATANRAANAVTVSGNDIDTEADFPLIRGDAVVDGDGSRTDASFSLNNAQVAGGSIAATLLDDLDGKDANTSAAVITIIGDTVTDSSMVSTGNTLNSGATGNRADNLLDLSGNGLATTSAIANFQLVSEEAQIASVIGMPGGVQEVMVDPGTEDIDPEPFEFEVTGNVSGHDGGDGVFIGGTLYVDATNLSATQREALEAAGWEADGENTYTRSAEGFAATITEYGTIAVTSPITRTESTAFIPGTPPTYDEIYVPGSGGVTIAIGGDVAGSTISVDGNSVAGSVTGNSASNALKVSATSVEDGSDHLLSYGTVDGLNTAADGDHVLANLQIVESDSSELTSQVYGTFAIHMDEGQGIQASTLSVDSNSQSSRTVANTADNSIELDAGNTAAGTALVSNQTSGADVLATSAVDIYTPVASSGSQVSMSDNGNLALAVVNNVANTLTVSANSVNPTTNPINAIVDVDSDAVAYADHVLVNRQVAEDTVSATAETTIRNQEEIDLAVGSVLGGTVTIGGNSTVAEATANRAVNLANVSAGSSLNAAAGVTNSQVSETLVTSAATTTVGVGLEADSGLSAAALNGGSITVGGNTTTALARGNTATNALNYAAGASYGTGSGNPAGSSLDSGSRDFRASAQAAVLNSQVNSGPVFASATDALYGVALNGGGNANAVTGSTVRVAGNSLSAAAYGNTANNSLTLASLNSGQPTAVVGNSQINSGSVVAAITTVTYGAMTSGGAVLGSSTAVSGNQISATAIGNSAVSVIAAR